MKIKNAIATTVLALTIIGGTAFTTAAQGPGCQKSGNPTCQHDKQGCPIANLTDDQQKKIDALRQTMMQQSLELQTQIKEKQAHLKTLTIAAQPDMAAINKTVDEIYVLKAELAKKREAHKQEVRKVLTEEQRLQFDMMHTKGCCGDGHQGGGQQKQGCQGAGPGCQGSGQGCQQKGPEGQGCQHQQQNGQGCQHNKTGDSK